MPDAVPPVTQDEREALRTIRRWRSRVGAILVAVLPVLWIVTRLNAPQLLFSIVATGLMLAFTICCVGAGLAKCPRCRKPFHRRGLWHDPGTRECLNCGLPLRPADDGPAAG